jgi:serine phosphatase RsbU (regulator of sigma subunit)
LIEPTTARILAATGPIVGRMDADGLFDHDVVELPSAGIVAAVTDGFTEARNAEREFLGSEALVDIIDRNRAAEAGRQAEALTRYAYEFANERLHDDIAALVVKVAS